MVNKQVVFFRIQRVSAHNVLRTKNDKRQIINKRARGFIHILRANIVFRRVFFRYISNTVGIPTYVKLKERRKIISPYMGDTYAYIN